MGGQHLPKALAYEGCSVNEGSPTNASTYEDCDARERASASIVVKSRPNRTARFCDTCRVGAGGQLTAGRPTYEGYGDVLGASTYDKCGASELTSASIDSTLASTRIAPAGGLPPWMDLGTYDYLDTYQPPVSMVRVTELSGREFRYCKNIT